MGIGTSHLDKRFQVFISSTFLDLKKERAELREALSKNNYIVEGMELFPAANKKQWQIIKDRIDMSDLYVLVIADNYGTVAATAAELEPTLIKDPTEAISYTRLEFRYAKSKGIPILAFIKENRKADAAIDAFVKEVQNSDLTTAYWKDMSRLIADVLAGLHEAIDTEGFAANNGWVRANLLNTPIHTGDKAVSLESKIQYVKFISYANKKTQAQPLYKKYVLRLNKEVEVWDEYVTLTINHLSHIVENFQYYVRTDGDAVDFSSMLPFLSKFAFADNNAGAKDTIFNPMVKLPSNVYVQVCSYYNGFQDGNMDLATKAAKDARQMKLIVDFTSIPNFEQLFTCVKCVCITEDGQETDITGDQQMIQRGIYLIEQDNVKEGTVLKFKFDHPQ